MKKLKHISLVIAMTIMGLGLFAQSSVSKLGYNFQGYAIDPDGKALGNTAITVKFTLYTESESQTFTEEQNLTSDAFGVFTAIIGNGSTASNNTFSNLNMNKDPFFLKVEVKKTANGSYTTISNAPMAAVPYAKRAENGVPVGTIIAFAGNTVPEGYLFCNGAGYDPNQYPELKLVLNDMWGPNRLPDLQGAFLRGDGNPLSNRNPDHASRVSNPNWGGASSGVGSFQYSEIISHDHGGVLTTSTSGNHNHNSGLYNQLLRKNNAGTEVGGGDNSAGEPNLLTSDVMPDAGNHNHTVTLARQGGSESRPYNAAVKYCIKY